MMNATPVPILYLHTHAEMSGGENSLVLLWEHLDRRRFQPALLGPPIGPLAERARSLGMPVRGGEFPRLRHLVQPAGWRRLQQLCAEARILAPRVVHGNAPGSNLVASLIGRRLGSRVVWHERTLPRGGEWDVDRRLAALPAQIICNSAAVARRFHRVRERVVVIRNGVPVDRFAPGVGGQAVRHEWGLGPDDVAVGIVGNFSEWKHHEDFLDAASRIAPELPQARFYVIGDETFSENRGREASLRARTAHLGLEARVHFAGRRADMPAVMDALDIVVSAAETEACSRAILEAMAAGTPVVAADAGGNPELVVPGETGLLFPPRDLQALAAALRTLIRDAETRCRLGRAARARVEAEFSIQQQVREIEAVYDAILQGS